MTLIMNDVREVMTAEKTSQLSIGEILKRLQKGPKQLKLKKDELMDVLNYYKRLDVIYIDGDDNVIIL